MTLTGTTHVYGIIGDPVSHSLSPKIHNYFFKECGLNAVYVPFPTVLSSLEETLLGLKSAGVKGLNVTVPFKEAVIPFLDEVDLLALEMQSVNTIVSQNGKWKGYSTDGEGLKLSLKEACGFELQGKKVVLIGAGGSAKSIVSMLLSSGISAVSVLNRSESRLTEFKPLFSSPLISYGLIESDTSQAVLHDADLVIQCSSAGLDGHMLPLSNFSFVKPDQLILDIIYSPAETPFLKESRLRGARTVNGLGMLLGQALLSFSYFTGQTPLSYSHSFEALF